MSDIEPIRNTTEDLQDEKQVEKQVEETPVGPPELVPTRYAQGMTETQWNQLLTDAIEAEETERALGIKAAILKYPKSVFWSFAISLCIIMEGFDTSIGVTGLEVFREKYGHPTGDGDYQLSPAWQAAPSGAIGSIIGIFVSSYFQDKVGYRRTIQGSLVAICAFLFVLFFSSSMPVYWFANLLCAIPFGAFSSSAVSYASEVTPVALRGYLTTYVNLCWVIGQFIASGALVGTQGINSQWAYKLPWTLQWAWIPPLFILATLAPDSPWWLVRTGRYEQAERAVQRLSSNASVDAAKTVAMMIRTNQMELEFQPGVSYLDCFRKTDLRRTEIACVAWACQNLCGAAFGLQGTYFFEQAGLPQAAAFKFNLGQQGIGFIGTCASWYTMTRYGRRKVFIWGLGALCVGLLLVGVLAVPSSRGNTGAKWAQAAIIMLWVFVYDFTIGPVAYCVVGEISSTRLRSKTVGLARNSYNVIGIATGYINTYSQNPLAWNWKGYAGFFWFGSCFLCLVWAYFRLPECKGRTFRELDILFETKVPARNFETTAVELATDEIVDQGVEVKAGEVM